MNILEKNNILISIPNDASFDAIASALALRRALVLLEKNVMVCADGEPHPLAIELLRDARHIAHDIPFNRYDIHLSPEEIRCEDIAMMLIEHFPRHICTTGVATLLLAGIMSATNCFRGRFTPQSLAIAGKLMDRGADHAGVVRALCRRHTVASMRALGERLQHISSVDEAEIFLLS